MLSVVFLCGGAAHAQTTPAAAPAATVVAKPVVLRGTLGTDQVQVILRRRADGEDGYEGDYFIFGSSQKVLLAGDVDAEDFIFEESENGTDISGQWEGKRTGDTMSGTWQSPGGTVKKSFNIQVLRTDGTAKQKTPNSAR
jgi:hypothetical protein